MSDDIYKELDAAIYAAISYCINPNSDTKCQHLSGILAPELGVKKCEAFRVLDRRLQKLRKMKKIEFLKKQFAAQYGKAAGWNLVDDVGQKFLIDSD
jgi:hypothetical protein